MRQIIKRFEGWAGSRSLFGLVGLILVFVVFCGSFENVPSEARVISAESVEVRLKRAAQLTGILHGLDVIDELEVELTLPG